MRNIDKPFLDIFRDIEELEKSLSSALQQRMISECSEDFEGMFTRMKSSNKPFSTETERWRQALQKIREARILLG